MTGPSDTLESPPFAIRPCTNYSGTWVTQYITIIVETRFNISSFACNTSLLSVASKSSKMVLLSI
jgi:hypothetical protein